MRELPASLVDHWLTLPQTAEELGVTASRVHQLLREHQLAAVRLSETGAVAIPAAFVAAGQIVKGLPGTLTLLADRGLSVEEAVEWLFTVDDSLPGRPIDALRADRGKEVRRRAQVIV